MWMKDVALESSERAVSSVVVVVMMYFYDFFFVFDVDVYDVVFDV